MFTKLRTVIYPVDDLRKAREWYSKITRVTPYFDESFYVGFNIYGYELGLDPDLTGTSTGERSVAYWSVDDIDAAVNILVNEGAVVLQPANQVGEGITVAVVKDPFGNSIGLIQETMQPASGTILQE
jgi:predicted enzyme related to lactoylglutathione lyase